MSFQALGLSAELLKAIHEQGYNNPTPVQQQAIPAILQGQHVIVTAETGTGKTAGFTLPLLHRLENNNQRQAVKHKNYNKYPRALILTPTRELAAQVSDSVRTYGKHLPLKSTSVFGGVRINAQIARLRQGIDILIATPGRLLDLVEQGCLNLAKIEIFVLDEADRMLDMGFIHDIRRIIKLLPQQRQNLLFSATFSKEVKDLADNLLHSPILIEVARRSVTAERITQVIYPVDRARKRELLAYLIGSKNWRQVLVFTRTKHGANKLAEQLAQDGLATAVIHGNKSQAARMRALMDFKKGKARVLVATDIAARGLDIDKLPFVVNFDLPQVPEDYVHRIGRTGRAENEGMAISLVSNDERNLLRNIEKLLKMKIAQEVITGYEPTQTGKGEQIQSFDRNKAAHKKNHRKKHRKSSHFNKQSNNKKPWQKKRD